jgi:hypothetical protein
MLHRLARNLLTSAAAGVLLLGMVGVLGSPASAYGGGKANYQVTFAGTATTPGTGEGFGFWGWCDFSGGNSLGGNAGDCQVAQYFHGPAGSGFTCHENVDITAWTAVPDGDFLASGTYTVNPVAYTDICPNPIPNDPPSPSGFSGDTEIPSTPGHYNIGDIFGPGTVGEFEVQVTALS